MSSIFFLWLSPWKPVRCGPDEGMEFTKMQLLLHYPEGARLAWNDQPWFYSQVFASIFSITGFQPGVPRLATLLVVSLLCAIFPRLMPVGAGWPHLVCTWLFFWGWSDVPHLAISAMCELPAFALAVVAAAVLPRSRAEWKPWRFILSGALWAVAIQIKLTAVIAGPAAAVMLAVVWLRDSDICPAWLVGRSMPRGRPAKLVDGASTGAGETPAVPLSWKTPVCGFVMFVGLFAILAWWSPVWDWAQLWGSHQKAAAAQQAIQYRFQPEKLLESAPGTLIAVALALLVLWRQRRLSEALFPVALLATVFTIHLNHQPWWYYYGVQLTIPFAILGGWGAGELLRLGVRRISKMTDSDAAIKEARPDGFQRETARILGALAVSLWMGFELPRAYSEVAEVSSRETIAESEAINVLKEYQGRAKWMFTRDNFAAAHAGFLVPPELTILSKKRFWSGNATEEMVIKTVKRYECEVLFLGGVELKNEEWKKLLAAGYVSIWSDGAKEMYVAKRLNPQPKPDNNEWLKKLGL